MDYQKSVTIKTNKEAAFNALTKELGSWWGEMDKPVEQQGDIFKVSWGEPWYQFKVIEYEPFDQVVWECIDANQIIGGLEGVEKEWVGNRLKWTIQNVSEGQVEVSLFHQGLIPEVLCFDVCSTTWDGFIGNSLKTYLEKTVAA